MIFPGQQINMTLSCPQCGKPLSNRSAQFSAFYMVCCDQEDCPGRGILLVIEKASGVVLWTSMVGGTHDGEKWVPTFPMQADRDGNQVWPEIKKPAKVKLGSEIKYHRYVDRQSLNDNTCAECGFFKDDPIHSPF